MGISDYMRALRAKVGHEYIVMPCAAVLVRDEKGRVLLVQDVEGRWQLPGGAVDPDESPADAARRECREEASVEVELGRIIGAFGGLEYRVTYANGDEVGVVSVVYEAAIVSGTPRPGDDETQDVGWFAPAELDGLELRATTRGVLAELVDPPGIFPTGG
jgi:8-oxo-dGTP pyrophosphatase MutT (NUDIX family)